MSTDFSQWNPAAANQETDATYQTDSQRTGGAPTGSIFPSLTGNKLLYQVSTAIRALMLAMVNKGYSPVDGTTPYQADTSSNAAVSALATVLANIVTLADLVLFVNVVSQGGTVQFGPALGGMTLQWGKVGAFAPSTPSSITFHATFATNIPSVFLQTEGFNAVWVLNSICASSVTTSGFTLEWTGTGGSPNPSFYWFAIGN